MRRDIEIELAFNASRHGQFDFDCVVGRNVRGTNVRRADLAFLQTKQVGGSERGGGFELQSVLAKQGHGLAVSRKTPGGFAVVSQNLGLSGRNKFQVITVWS